MAKKINPPVSSTTIGNFPVSIDLYDPENDPDILEGTIVTPNGNQRVRWNENGTGRDIAESANISGYLAKEAIRRGT